MRRSVVLVAVAAAILAAACGDDAGRASRDEPPVPFDSAAVLTGSVSAVGGETVDLGAFAGADLVVWFWAPW